MVNLVLGAKQSRINNLVKILNQASDAYYNGKEVMSDYEYDQLLEELVGLEKSTGIILPDSPTHNVGSPTKVEKIQKVKHEFPAKSLDKTKDIDLFVKTFDVYHDSRDKAVLMWKLDGCTIQLTYNHGKLICAATRGDGYIGQNITHNAYAISGIPLTVKDMHKFVVRGEAVISYSDFETINSTLSDSEKYKNPRNLASASVTLLDSNELLNRHVHFKMFELVSHPDLDKMSFFERIKKFGSSQNFETVECILSNIHNDDLHNDSNTTLRDLISSQTFNPKNYEFPVDGLVCAFNDTNYTKDLEGTDHHPNILKGYALKWEDEIKETTLRDVEWSPSRTGLLNPVAVFDPVEIAGTTVSRASLHNFSIMRKLHLRIGDKIGVYKANLVIPQIAVNYSKGDSYSDEDLSIIGCCPSCYSPGRIKLSNDGIESVYCENPKCSAKVIYKLVHFCERSCMNIEGLSESTITKFVNLGFINSFSDIYELGKHKDEISSLPGFGDKSWANIYQAIESSKNTTFVRFVTALGIPGIGSSQAKSLDAYFKGNINEFIESKDRDFSIISGIGSTVSTNIQTWLADNINYHEAKSVIEYLKFPEYQYAGNLLSGKTFVITGSLKYYKNRKDLEATIEENGGKVSSSVSKNTSYLINNDIESTSSKNKRANELNIPIITEAKFINMIK